MTSRWTWEFPKREKWDWIQLENEKYRDGERNYSALKDSWRSWKS